MGYQVNPSIGLEAGYGSYGETTYSAPGITLSAAASGFQFSAVGSLPISDAFALTGKLGIALTKGKISGTGLTPGFSRKASTTTVAYGVGVRYIINKTVAVRAQYENLGKIKIDNTYLTDMKNQLMLFTVGVIYSF